MDDLKSYRADISDQVIKAELRRGNLTLHTSPLPGTGILLAFILRVMQNFDDLYPKAFKSLDSSVLFFHRLMETYKFAFGQRVDLGDNSFENVTQVMDRLADQRFIEDVVNKINDNKTFEDPGHYGAEVFMSEDHGTSHVAVVDKYGNAASVSSTVNM